ncbi:MAG: hypothetical protein M1830_010390 [Pleopsidium flavum]|nr:MAG: hypothetical protein M1830_010390 [Pleopsidium flavum]
MQLFQLNNLKKLGLESCWGSTAFLSVLIQFFSSITAKSAQGRSQTSPLLKSFTFRHEQPTPEMIDNLEKFFSSSSGLEEVSVLLDNTNKMLHPRCFCTHHGPSLKALIWEGREAPRTAMNVDTSIITGGSPSNITYLDEICKNCPNLIELGIPIWWKGNLKLFVCKPLARLCHLRTLYIRNPPLKQRDDVDSTIMQNFTDVAAAQIIQCLADVTRHYEDPLKIQLFVIGVTTYRDMLSIPYTTLEATGRARTYLQPIFFHVDYHRDILGCPRPLLTKIGKKTVKGVRDYTSNMRSFKTHWLN